MSLDLLLRRTRASAVAPDAVPSNARLPVTDEDCAEQALSPGKQSDKRQSFIQRLVGFGNQGNATFANGASKPLSLGLAGSVFLTFLLLLHYRTRISALNHCTYYSISFKQSLTSIREELETARTDLKYSLSEKLAHEGELINVKKRMDNLTVLKEKLKDDLEEMISAYVLLKRNKAQMSYKSALGKTEAQELEAQTRQLESLVQHLHSGIKALDISGGVSAKEGRGQ